MTKEQLIEYKKKLSELSKEELKQRDIEYLRKLATGEIQGPPVGYASIDKPWLKYYSEEQLLEEAPKISFYENLIESNTDYTNDISIEYFGKKITYEELLKNIEKTAQAYASIGVKKGDIVTICSITTPEIIYSIFALNKIGAISNLIDVRYTSQAIEMYLKEVGSKYLVTLDICYPKIKDIIKQTNVEKVVTISPTNSAPTVIKTGAKIKNVIKKENVNIPCLTEYVDWNDFIKNGENTQVETVQYIENYPAVIVHTGGTTGIPKGVLLSNENINNVTLQIKNSNVNAKRGYKFLNIMPPFIAYGIALGLITPITLGWNTTIIPVFEADKFDKLIKKHKPNGVMGVPTYWEKVMSSKKMKKEDLSYLKNILLGGDKIKPEFEKKLEEFLISHKCDIGVGKGYSMTEASACATFSSKSANKLESVGIPLVKTTISIFEPNTTTELSPYELGEICIKTPTMMLEYYEKEEETKKVKKLHEDGYWIHSGDIGYIDENGLVYPKDRIKRMIPRSGFKVFPSEIENLFLSHPAVETCAVVGIPDPIDVTAPKAHIVIMKEYKEQSQKIIEDLITMFKESTLPPYFEPVDYKIRDSLPLTDIGKINYIALQEEETKVKTKTKKQS